MDVSTLCATSGPREISFVMTDEVLLFAMSQTALRFRGVFNAPFSTQSTDSFKVVITDSAGAVLTEDDGALYLSGLEPNKLQKASITQVNSVTVGAPTAVYFSVTTLNPVPPQGGVQIKFPKWNPKASVLTRESYVLDEGAFNVDGQTLPAKEPAAATDLPIDPAKLCSAKRVSNLHHDRHRFKFAEYVTLGSQRDARVQLLRD